MNSEQQLPNRQQSMVQFRKMGMEILLRNARTSGEECSTRDKKQVKEYDTWISVQGDI